MDECVCISIVTKRDIYAGTARWLLRTFVDIAPNVEVHIIDDPRPLQHARCLQVQRFLASECTHLFLLDSDCVPKFDTIKRLLAHKLPIVSAPHPALKGDEFGFMVLDRNPNGPGYIQHTNLDGLQGPDVVVGCAGMMIHRDVFKTISTPWFACEYDENGFITKTEDFYFCEKAHASGIGVWADCTLFQRHYINVMV
jgi:GT2 family glycosyltransferase